MLVCKPIIEIIQNMLSDWSRIKLEINKKKELIYLKTESQKISQWKSYPIKHPPEWL